MSKMDRRSFMKIAAATGVAAAWPWKHYTAAAPAAAVRPRLVKFPQKTELMLLTDRPPNLEMPIRYLAEEITPNEAFFVRWHLAGIPTTVDPAQHRLRISGHVGRELSLSLAALKTEFEPVTITAVCQCAGNSRAFFEPRVAGVQWGNGAVGNARWTGVRLRDLLARAGMKEGAQDVSFHGLDCPPIADTPAYIKALDEKKAHDPDVLVAYQMNGADLPMLNGYPLRLVVPGWYATYWIKALEEIRVWPGKFAGFWMDKGYRVPDRADAAESPEKLADQTVPITQMSVRSLFGVPAEGSEVAAGQAVELAGVAFDGGSGIRVVEVSVDGGRTWTQATLGMDLGKYSFRRWSHAWTPRATGPATIMVRATANSGETQTHDVIWNRSGYRRNVIEQIKLMVV